MLFGGPQLLEVSMDYLVALQLLRAVFKVEEISSQLNVKPVPT